MEQLIVVGWLCPKLIRIGNKNCQDFWKPQGELPLLPDREPERTGGARLPSASLMRFETVRWHRGWRANQETFMLVRHVLKFYQQLDIPWIRDAG
jgi:hypothetical protein